MTRDYGNLPTPPLGTDPDEHEHEIDAIAEYDAREIKRLLDNGEPLSSPAAQPGWRVAEARARLAKLGVI